MKLHKFLQKVMFLTLFLSKTNSYPISVPQSKPGCPSKCGNITITFPFGTQENCYLDQSYMVNCNETSGKARISGTDIDIVDFSPDGQLRAVSPVAYACYNHSSKVRFNDPRVNLTRFPLAVNRNKVTTLGCDTRGDIKTGNIKKGLINKGSCLTMPGICPAVSECSSTIGCCQGAIKPEPITNFRFHVESNERDVGKEGFNNCSYAFIVEDGRYNFSSLNVFELQMEDLETYQLVLDWSVGNTSCREAQRDRSSYLCKENSECRDSDNGPGYRCSCADGFEGNGYFQNGCQDVDECKDDRIHGCSNICNNTIGNYTCVCPKGYSGDGRKNGTRCVKNGTNLQKLGLYVGISVGAIVTALTMVFVYCLMHQRRRIKLREQNFKQNGGLIFEKILSECDDSTQIVTIFTEKELKNATDNFNPNNVIGQGGFGTVYKGILPNNTILAIKKSKLIDRCQIEQFVNEVVILSQINHPNIVKLIGCCLETHVPLLAYEFVVNETLQHHLHKKVNGGSALTWKMRLSIALETAEALAYMHSTTQIIHRDIKSSNILLTFDYKVKVSDFGISRFVPVDKTHVSTAVQGTLGYIDPEYFGSGILTDKSDVYSFGVLLVEMLTGEKVNTFVGVDGNRSLVAHFVSSVNEDRLIKVIDDQVMKDISHDQVNRVGEVAKSCVETEGKRRPTMKEVKEELEAILQKKSTFDF